MPIGRTPFLSLVAVLMAAPGTAAAGQDAAPVVRTPSLDGNRDAPSRNTPVFAVVRPAIGAIY